jgi:hypothetical protein
MHALKWLSTILSHDVTMHMLQVSYSHKKHLKLVLQQNSNLRVSHVSVRKRNKILMPKFSLKPYLILS